MLLKLNPFKSSHILAFSLIALIGLEAILFLCMPEIFITFSLTLALLLFFILSVKHYRAFIRDWICFILLINTFNLLRGASYFIIQRFKLPIYSKYVIDFEHLFSPHTTIAHLLQTKLTQPTQFNLLEKIMALTYASHFISFWIVCFLIWYKQVEQFYRAKNAFLCCFFIGLIFYFVVPTTPPWLASDQGLIDSVRNTPNLFLKQNMSTLVTVFDTNPVAAMPSLHVAISLLCFLCLAYHYGYKAWPASIYFLMIVFSTILLGSHYIADILGGILLAVFSYLFFYKYYSPPQYKKQVSNSELGIEIVKALLILLITIIPIEMLSSL